MSFYPASLRTVDLRSMITDIKLWIRSYLRKFHSKVPDAGMLAPTLTVFMGIFGPEVYCDMWSAKE